MFYTSLSECFAGWGDTKSTERMTCIGCDWSSNMWQLTSAVWKSHGIVSQFSVQVQKCCPVPCATFVAFCGSFKCCNSSRSALCTEWIPSVWNRHMLHSSGQRDGCFSGGIETCHCCAYIPNFTAWIVLHVQVKWRYSPFMGTSSAYHYKKQNAFCLSAIPHSPEIPYIFNHQVQTTANVSLPI